MSGRLLLPTLLRGLQKLLAPGVCQGCGTESVDSAMLCRTCRPLLPVIDHPCCYCGQPNPVNTLVCPACLRQPPVWQGLVAPLHYRGLTRELLLQLKNGSALHLATGLCELTCEQLEARRPRPEVLLPVPLHRARLLERGYNQAGEIARAWSRLLDLPVDYQALSRTRSTIAQAGLSQRQRRQNIASAFAYRPRRQYRHVAIVDDIVTTGSTAGEIAGLLHRHEVEHVEVWALARTCRN